MPPQPSPRRPPSVSVRALTQQLKGMLESRFQRIWIEGEMAQVKVHHSGNIYFTLKDADARIDGVVWRSAAERIQMLRGYQPLDGHRVLALGSLSVYAPRGAYSLVVERFLPAGIGDLQVAFEKLKRALAAEGLFDAGRKRALPLLPRAVGVVTSPTGAARHDIETVIHRRSPQVPIVLYPAQVQGDGAAEDVASGIAALAARPGIDVIIVGRGGGSLEDLWAFNEERVARAIAACGIPVISAVGHQTDITIADLVADARAATPSEAAEMSVPIRSDLLYALDGLADRLARSMGRGAERRLARLLSARQRLVTTVDLAERARRLERLTERLDRAMHRCLEVSRRTLRAHERALRERHPVARIARARRRLDGASQRLKGQGSARLAAARARLDTLDGRLQRAGDPLIVSRRSTLRLLVTQLEALSPLASLGRGFSVTRAGGRVVRAAHETAVGETLEILLHQGRLQARVTAVHPDDEEPR